MLPSQRRTVTEERPPPNPLPPYPSPWEKTGTSKDLDCRDGLCLHPVTPKPPPFLPSSIPSWFHLEARCCQSLPPCRHKAAVLTCRKKSEGTRGTEGGAVTLDKREKRAELCGPVEVREADITPEKSTIVKGTGRAGKARGPEGYPLPTEGWLWLYAPRACCRGVPSSVKPICCLSAAWRVKPRVPLVYRDTKLL